MTEKRFNYIPFDGFDDNGKELSAYEVLEILNEQHETIERLKVNIDELMQFDVEDDLLKENEQLRTKNNAYIQDIEVFKEENTHLKLENEQLKSDKEHLMGCLIRFFGYDDEDIDYNLNRESNREYGKQYYSMKEETKNEL